jgi:hypothetical protein
MKVDFFAKIILSQRDDRGDGLMITHPFGQLNLGGYIRRSCKQTVYHKFRGLAYTV